MWILYIYELYWVMCGKKSYNSLIPIDMRERVRSLYKSHIKIYREYYFLLHYSIFVLFYTIKWATIKQRIKSALTTGYTVKSSHIRTLLLRTEKSAWLKIHYLLAVYTFMRCTSREAERESDILRIVSVIRIMFSE